MKSTGNYFFVKKLKLEKDFTQIPNQLFQLKLTPAEKLILIYLMSNTENFRITSYRIKQEIGSDYRTVKKLLDKCKKLNYLIWINENTFQFNIDAINSTITNSNSTNSNLTNSKLTNSTLTNSNSNRTNSIVVNLPLYDSQLTTNIVVELPSNNTKTTQTENTKLQNDTQQAKNLVLNSEKPISVSTSSLTSNKEYDLTPETISIYFSESLNKKLFNLFLQQPKEFKLQIPTYYQFEKLYLKTLIEIFNDSKLGRPVYVEMLNKNFEKITPTVLNKMNIQDFKANEIKIDKQLQFMKLGI